MEKATYRQEKDCCDGETPESCDQIMEVEVEDGGGGAFVVIKTKRWAFDEEGIDDFANHLKQLIKMWDVAESRKN